MSWEQHISELARLPYLLLQAQDACHRVVKQVELTNVCKISRVTEREYKHQCLTLRGLGTELHYKYLCISDCCQPLKCGLGTCKERVVNQVNKTMDIKELL